MADFRKESGNSTKDVEMIAVVRPNRVFSRTDKETGESKVTDVYVDFMVNNSAVKKADIQAGKGQADPNLYSKKVEYTAEDGSKKTRFDHGIRMTSGQLETIEQAGGKNTLVKEDGTKYIPFKADLQGLKKSVKDADGKIVKNDDGTNKERMVGYMPNTKTVEPTELGRLTQNRLDKHFDNTKAINEVQSAQRAETKAAKLQEAGTKVPPEASADKGKETSMGD